MYRNLRTPEAGQEFIQLEECVEYVHAKICKNKNEHAAIRCRTVESLQGMSGLRVIRWMTKHPRDIAYPELLLHSAICQLENCDMKDHAKKSQGAIVRAVREWLKNE